MKSKIRGYKTPNITANIAVTNKILLMDKKDSFDLGLIRLLETSLGNLNA